MTRAEVQNVPGFHVETIKAAIAFIRASVPRHNGATDPTALIRSEGKHEQNAAVCELLQSLLEPEAPKKESVSHPYSKPAVHQQPIKL